MPRHNMVMKGQWNARWPDGDMPRSSQGIPLRACRARPSAGGPTGGHGPCGGKPRDGARGRFLGGTRSARPHGKAERMPGHVMTTQGRARGPVAYRGWRVGKTRAFPCGRAEPAPRELALRRKPSGEEDTRSSRSAALCVSSSQGHRHVKAFRFVALNGPEPFLAPSRGKSFVSQHPKDLKEASESLVAVKTPPIRDIAPYHRPFSPRGPSPKRAPLFISLDMPPHEG